MTIKLTASILIAGASQPTGTSLTLNAAAEAELVNRGVAVYTSRALAPGEGLVPAMMNAARTALVDPVTGGVILLNDTIRRAITAAKGNNPVDLEPWLLPELWTITTTYYNGQIVRNSAGNAYMMWPNQAGIGVGVVSTGTEPVHKTQVPTIDGAAGVYWMYLGKARGLASGTYASATPAAATDTMAGYVACANVGTPEFVSTTLGLSRYVGVSGDFTYTNFPARLIGLRNTSLADSVNPDMLGVNEGTLAAPVYNSSGVHYGVHFKTNSRWIFIQAGGPVYAGFDRNVIEVNGRRISDSAITRPNSVSKDGRLLDLSKFAGTEKDVKIFSRDSLRNDLMYGIYSEPTAYVLPGEVANSFKIAFEGDSLTGGGNGLPTFEGNTWVFNAAQLLGASNWFVNAVGSTGFISDNSGTRTTYINRLARINLFAPDVLVVMGGHNDAAISTSAARQAAVLLYLQTFRAANPNAYIFMFGNLLLQGESVATQQTSELDISAAVTTFNDSRCAFVPVLTDPKGSWYAGGSINGNYFYNTGSAPFADSHHTIGAYKMLEQMVASKIRNYFAA